MFFEGHQPLQFTIPTDIAFNTINNMVYIADTGKDRIQVLNSDLTSNILKQEVVGRPSSSPPSA